MDTFQRILEKTLRWEGGLSDDAYDAGGLTKYGISQRAYPNLDIRNLTLEDAKRIYKRDYWYPNGYNKIWDNSIAGFLFDTAVNSGPRDTGKMAQRAALAHGKKLKVDGVLGPLSRAAINEIGHTLLPTLISERVSFYRLIVAKNRTQTKFLRGWLRRAYDFA